MKGSGGGDLELRVGVSRHGALCGFHAGEEVGSPGQDRNPSVARLAPWQGGVSGPGTRARTRWIACGLWLRTERSGLRAEARSVAGNRMLSL